MNIEISETKVLCIADSYQQFKILRCQRSDMSLFIVQNETNVWLIVIYFLS